VQPVRKDQSNSRSRRTEGWRASRKVIELRRARVVALVLLLVAAALYVSPLRAFFAAQDSYFSQRSALSAVQAANRALHRQISEMHSATYVERQAREEYQLVPAGLQAFVVKGLPTSATGSVQTGTVAPAPLRLSLGMRLGDLWHTLRE
jgi:cell division protein FtsB